MILHIALLSVPLRKSFDYLPLPPEPADTSNSPDRLPPPLQPGIRIRVPFGHQQRIGILLGSSAQSQLPLSKLKPISEVVDPQPLLPEALHQLLLQAARYYHHPLGEVYESALPLLLRQGRAAQRSADWRYHTTEAGGTTNPPSLHRAPRQQELLALLQQHPEGLDSRTLQGQVKLWRGPTQALIKRGLVERSTTAIQAPHPATASPHPLNPQQQQAVEAIHQLIASNGARLKPLLLEGVTGSGKTEVYLQAIQRVVDSGRQALVLVPEISLTPQTVQRFRERFSTPVVLIHSGRSPTERLNSWLAAREGSASIIIGTRSALFVPMKYPGIVIVDEEHDSSFKQHEGFRYSARDLAVLRGYHEQIPVVLGSATPAFESLHNAASGKYLKCHLSKRAGAAQPPEISLIDVRSRKISHLLSTPLIEKIEQHLQQQGQVLLFLNRRGYAPTLFCTGCGWSASCPRCEIHYTYHQQSQRMVCHHCGAERPQPRLCPECGQETIKPLGAGTERVEEALQQQFPDHSLSRIDRDTTRKQGAMDEKLEQIHAGTHQILLGTQMLAKGHHFPNVTLVGILDADGGLYGSDFRATEQMGQLITQVAGRAGRAARRGEMVLQTHNTDHPLLLTLLQQGYPAFAEQALAERKQAALPPYSYLTLIRAESAQAELARSFLEEVRQMADHY
ncbi:MAG: primosomal protein N', partial [Gammaproteobacteria bacterium]|nr:primosomal protein N' [Gammaproteobacteria bacterium]